MTLRLYDVPMNGSIARLRLSEEDAQMYGATLVDEQAPADAQDGAAQDEQPAAKQRTAQNKARTPSEK